MSIVTHNASRVASDRDRLHDDAGIDPVVGSRARRDALRAAIARHGGVIDWTVDHTGWVATLYLPVEGTFLGSTLEDGLRSCFAWLVASERPDALALAEIRPLLRSSPVLNGAVIP
jgi:hypothetical protein